MEFYKYQGAGNDFLIFDNRDGRIVHGPDAALRQFDDCECLTERMIAELCDRRYGIGADGVMLLESANESASETAFKTASDPAAKSPLGLASDGESAGAPANVDFRMTYYNSDGSGGMMCGNGGRCIVAFAADMGMNSFCFEAADGIHEAEILESHGKKKIIRLRMKNIDEVVRYDAENNMPQGCFIDTGTRHFVTFSEDLDSVDLIGVGRSVRYDAKFAPAGVNVNFVACLPQRLKVRTYEKGVEDETYACGTGIVASAVVSYLCGVTPSHILPDGRVRYDVEAVRDSLSVDFIPHIRPCSFRPLGAEPGSMVASNGLTADSALDSALDSASAFDSAFDSALDSALGAPVASDVFLTGPAERVAMIHL